MRRESRWSDCLAEATLTRPAVPSAVSYELRRRGNEPSKALGQCIPQPTGWHRNREATVYLPASGGAGLGWRARSAYANSRSRVVNRSQPKVLSGWSWSQARKLVLLPSWANQAPGVQRGPHPFVVIPAERGKPVALPFGGRTAVRPTMALRVKDEGESERRPLMGRIRGATFPGTKVSRLPSGLASRESGANRPRKQSR